jgi:hypothetical protein
VSPFRTPLLPQPRVYSQPSDVSGQSRNVSHAISFSCRLFNSLCALFRARFLCFQQLADSFCKIPGAGYPDPVFGLSAGVDEDSRCRRCFYGMPGVWGTSAMPRRTLRLSVIIFLCLHRPCSPRCFVTLAIPSSPRSPCALSTFRINTCKSVSKQMTLTPFRINTYEKPRGRGVQRLTNRLEKAN